MIEKLAKSIAPIIKKVDEVYISIKKIAEVLQSKSEDVTRQLAIKNTQPQPPIQNTWDDTHPGIIYDTSLENTLSDMKNNFFKIVENQNGHIFWNGIKLKKLGDTKIQLGDGDEDDFIESIQDGILNKTLFKNLNDKDILILNYMMEALNFNRYQHAPASFKSENMGYNRYLLPGRVLQIEADLANESECLEKDGMKIMISSSIIDIYKDQKSY